MPDLGCDRIPLAAVSSVRGETWGGEAAAVVQVELRRFANGLNVGVRREWWVGVCQR